MTLSNSIVIFLLRGGILYPESSLRERRVLEGDRAVNTLISGILTMDITIYGVAHRMGLTHYLLPEFIIGRGWTYPYALCQVPRFGWINSNWRVDR